MAKIAENIASDFKKACIYIVLIIFLAIFCCSALLGAMDRIAEPFIWTAIFSLLAAFGIGNIVRQNIIGPDKIQVILCQ